MMTHTNSRRWESPDFQARNAFNRKSGARKRFFKANYNTLQWVLPQDHNEENLHHASVLAAQQNFRLKQEMEDQRGLQIPTLAFGGKTNFAATAVPDMASYQKTECPEAGFSMSTFNKVEMPLRSTVLAQPTIWLSHQDTSYPLNKLAGMSKVGFYCNTWPEEATCAPLCPDDQSYEASLADWPCHEQMKFEGHDRIATDVKHGRFLPVPRKRGNSTVAWLQLPFLEQHEFDRVHSGGSIKKPSVEDVHFMELEVGFDGHKEEHVADHLLGQELLAELDPRGIYTAEEDFSSV